MDGPLSDEQVLAAAAQKRMRGDHIREDSADCKKLHQN